MTPDSLDTHSQQFLRERTYLHNITPNTRQWYEDVWKVFSRWRQSAPARPSSAPLISRADLQEFAVHLRERGVKPVSCNCYMRGINAFCRWLHQQGHIDTVIRLGPQRLEKRLLPLHSVAALRLLSRLPAEDVRPLARPRHCLHDPRHRMSDR